MGSPESPAMQDKPHIHTYPSQKDRLKASVETYAGRKVQEATGQDTAKINKALEELYAATPDTVPEAEKLPPHPALYVYDNGGYEVQSVTSPSNKYTALGISSKMLDLPPEKLKAAIAHEFAHLLMVQNPDMAENYKPRDAHVIDKELKRLDRDETKYGMPAQEKVPVRRQFMKELQADDIAVRITRDPKTYRAFLKETMNAIVSDSQKALRHNIRNEIALEQKDGQAQTTKDKMDIARGMLKATPPYPSNKARDKETRAEGEQLGITKETFVEHFSRKVKELMETHGKNEGAPQIQNPDTTPKALSTPFVQHDTGTGIQH